MPVINQSRRTWVVSKVKKADRLLTRIVGWIGRSHIDPEAALWVKPCFGIHTFGMNFPVDLLFLEKDNRVVGLVSNLPINRVSPIVFRAWSVLVLPAHSIEKSRTMNGDFIDVS
jgi:uncharacterized membrane protein (UPF0127 family)